MTLHPKRLVAMIATVAAGSAVAATFAVSSASAAVATDASTSANWAGYVADNATFSSVSGSWVVPSGPFQLHGEPVVRRCEPALGHAAAAEELWRRSAALTGVRYSFTVPAADPGAPSLAAGI